MIGRESDDQPWNRLRALLAVSGASRRRSLPAKLLVVSWGSSSAKFSVYDRVGTQPNRLDSFEIEWTEEEQHSSQVLGDRIAVELRRRSVSVRETVVSLPRRFVVLKNLELPATEEASIPAMVQLQCENLFPVSRATLEVDYIQHKSLRVGDTSILVVAVPKPVIQVVVDSLQHAGLKPLALGVGELGVPLLSPPRAVNELQLDLMANGNKFEFLISRDQLPVISHAGQAPDTIADRTRYISSTTNRLLQAANQRLPDLSTTQIHAYGEFDDEAASELMRAIRVPIKFHAEHSVETIRERALLAVLNAPHASIDFLNPRKPIDPAVSFRRKVLVAAAAAAVAIALIGLPLAWSSYALDRELASIKQQKVELTQQVERLEPLEKTWKKLIAFNRARIDYAAELKDLMNRMKPSEQMHLTNVEVNETSGSGTVLVRLKGMIKDRDTWTTLTNDFLVASDRFRLRAPQLEPNVGDMQYGYRFTIELELKQNGSESPSGTNSEAIR